MQINGEWLRCDDSIVRPVIRGHILDGHGGWIHAPFLVDRELIARYSVPRCLLPSLSNLLYPQSASAVWEG